MRRHGILTAVLVAAVALRVWGLANGLPFPMGRPDEVEALRQTRWFPTGDLNPRWFVYPNLFFWVEWLWLETVLAVRRLFVATPPYADMLDHDLPALLLYGRVLSALAGTATVAVVYAIGRRLGDWRLGVVAALLLAGNFLHVRDSHALKADVLLALSFPIALWAIARHAEQPDRRRAWLAGIAIGIATGLKYPGIVLLVPVYVAHLWTAPPGGGLRRWRPSPAVLMIGAVAATTFLLTSPYLLSDHERLVETFTNSVKLVYGLRPEVGGRAGSALQAVVTYLRTRSFDYHVTASLRHGCGLAMALATPVALALGLRRREPMGIRLAAITIIVYYVVISASQVTLARYLTPATPLLALVVARLVLESTDRIAAVRLRRLTCAAVLALLVAEPVASSVAHDRIAARTDTRVLATNWMAEHLPPGAVVARLGSRVFAIADPELPPGVRDAELPLLGDRDLDRRGVTYVVSHEHPLPFSRPDPAILRRYAARLVPLAEFSPFRGPPAGAYEDLDAYYIPFYDFAGVVRPGPLVRIYRLDPEGSPAADGPR